MPTKASLYQEIISNLTRGNSNRVLKDISLLEKKFDNSPNCKTDTDKMLLDIIRKEIESVSDNEISDSRADSPSQIISMNTQSEEQIKDRIDQFNNQLKDIFKKWNDEHNAFRNHIINLHAWREFAYNSFNIRRALKILPLPPVPEKLSPVMPGQMQAKHLPKLSIITPSYNCGEYIERAIKSVLSQDYPHWEHIIVDGGSTDNTIDILEKYGHLNWISESDRGQVHAMNKGFSMARGDVISYLNADDYYNEGAFRQAAEQFANDGIDVVYGNVHVFDVSKNVWWMNEPKYDFHSVLRHWEPNAFCVNPVGYFYRRNVQELIPIREEDGAKHDLAFLMEMARKFEKSSVKINHCFGTFMHAPNTQTTREQSFESYWSPDNFSFIDRFLVHLSEDNAYAFRQEQKAGYELRKKWLRDAREARSLYNNSEYE